MKNIRLVLADHEHELLKQVKGNMSWHYFLVSLANVRTKECSKNDIVSRDSLKNLYRMQAKVLSEIGKLMAHKDQEGYAYNTNFYLASVLPLIVVGEDVGSEDLMGLYVLVINLVFEYLKERYREKNETLYFLFEYLRTAVIRELRGDTIGFYRLMKEVCSKLSELGELP